MAERLKIETLQLPSKQRAANEARFDSHKHADLCLLCGKPLTQAALDRGRLVHLTVHGELLLAGDEIDPADDQGFFPVGSDCARKLGAYATR